MASKTVFGSSPRGKITPPATTINQAGGRAYDLGSKHSLAQFACTGTLNDCFYSKAEEQLDAVLELCKKIDPTFVAKTAVYARESGSMKDMPALLAAILTTVPGGGELLKKIFPRVMDNGKMLRNFVQMIRSGQLGRKSFGTMPKRLVQKWFASRTDDDIFRSTVGNDPSLADVIKLCRPKPDTESRRALYGYIIGAKGTKIEYLPELVQQFELFKLSRLEKSDTRSKMPTMPPMPKVPMEMLTGLKLFSGDWELIASQASWTQTRMNLAAWNKQGVFKTPKIVEMVSSRLRDPELVKKSKVFPYQLLMTYSMTEGLPVEIRDAIQDAMEIACASAPVVEGKVVICPDVSGSMSSPVTGHRTGATTKVRCIDIAALVSAVFMRKNPGTRVIPFEQDVVNRLHLNGQDSIMTNATKLASIGGGGTNCSAPLHLLNREGAQVDLVVFVSDNESWADPKVPYGRGTRMLAEWNALKVRCPKAKLVCIDIQAGETTQAGDREDILNIGGFSDSVFEVISRFISGATTWEMASRALAPEHWVSLIEGITL